MEGAAEVGVDNVAPLRIAHAGHEPVLGDPGVVDQDHDRPKRRLGGRESRVDAFGVGDVDGDRDRGAALGLDRGDGLGATGRVASVAARDVVAGASQGNGDRATNASGRAGHERDARRDDCCGLTHRLLTGSARLPVASRSTPAYDRRSPRHASAEP
jgi:hypothetical protein